MTRYPGLTVACWDQDRHHHGPCCMDCIIEETNRRAGCDVPDTIESLGLVDPILSEITLTLRACCFHHPWLEERLMEQIADRD